ncbi:MAG: DUF2490 domain-containing protein [Bacteroidetes bacterium]|nr:DUF2490 domain-containing protein [Bacteroidota bacterium]
MNNPLRFLGILGLLFVGVNWAVYSQTNDAGLWTNITLEKKLTSRYSAFLSEEIRMNENISEIGTAFTEIGVSYKIMPGLNAGISYRFIQKRQLDDSYEKRHRYMVDGSYRFKMKKFSITLRERFQSQYSAIRSSETGNIPDNYLRNKLTLKYDIRKKLTASVSSEVFFQLNNPDGNEIDNLRHTAGLEYKLNKANIVEVFYLINKEINKADPVTDYVIGCGYTYSF